MYDEKYIEHLDELCKTLFEMNKIVYITPPPYIPSLAFTEIYQNFIDKTKEYVKNHDYVKLGPDLFIPSLQKSESLCFDKVHYNSKGYKELSKIYYEIIKKDLIKIEYNKIKDLLE